MKKGIALLFVVALLAGCELEPREDCPVTIHSISTDRPFLYDRVQVSMENTGWKDVRIIWVTFKYEEYSDAGGAWFDKSILLKSDLGLSAGESRTIEWILNTSATIRTIDGASYVREILFVDDSEWYYL